MASLDERLSATNLQDDGDSSSQKPPYPLNRQSTIAHPSEVTYGYR